MAASIGGNREREARVDANDSAGDDSAPRDSHEPDLVGINLRERTQQRVREHRVRHCVVHPLIPQGLGGVSVDPVALGTAPGMSPPRPPGPGGDFLGLVRLALDSNRDRGITAFGPFLDPFPKGRATSSMDKHDGGNLAIALVRQSQPSKDSGGSALPWQPFEVNRLDAAVAGEAFGRESGRWRREVAELEHQSALFGEIFRGSEKGRRDQRCNQEPEKPESH